MRSCLFLLLLIPLLLCSCSSEKDLEEAYNSGYQDGAADIYDEAYGKGYEDAYSYYGVSYEEAFQAGCDYMEDMYGEGAILSAENAYDTGYTDGIAYAVSEFERMMDAYGKGYEEGYDDALRK